MKNHFLPRTIARFAAVQALFQQSANNASLQNVIQEFISYHFTDDRKYKLYEDQSYFL